ncbi:hypothetical protein E3N88_18057 [Mikania micrantha]|uniref:Uncharacterized protein n=1 Tax=Mikania micrantha TaxID=192012 RepID=A0A5N6NTR0_9ASTR|nr:hypothetical protein E3N88_18057 [Mikania micrantha]
MCNVRFGSSTDYRFAEDPVEDPEEDPVENPDEDPEEDPEEDPQEDPEDDPQEEPQRDPGKAPVEDSSEESSYRMPPRFRACKRPRFESDDVTRLTWESKWANDRIEHMAQELRDVNARYAELRKVVQGIESHIVHLTTRVQEEEHRADIAEWRLIALEEQFVSEAEEEEEEEEIPEHDFDSEPLDRFADSLCVRNL